MEKYLYLPQEQKAFLWAAVGEPMEWLVLWLLMINLVTFFVFGIDKWKAKRKEKKETVRRIPEKTLFLLAVLGGSLGALAGMRVWRHKTQHMSFKFGIPAILVLQLAVLLGLWFWGVLGT